MNVLGLEGYNVYSVEHSLSDNEGESDLTIILSNDIQKIALLIENKIDAIAMPIQYERYTKRGNKGVKSMHYDSYFVFIVAPIDYLISNQEAQKYPFSVSYERLAEYFEQSNNIYGNHLIKAALERKKKGYSVIEDKEVTEYWQYYYRFVKENYPKLRMYEVTGP